MKSIHSQPTGPIPHMAIALVLLATSQLAAAGHANGEAGYDVYAKVVAVTPQYEEYAVVEPVQSCYRVQPSHARYHRSSYRYPVVNSHAPRRQSRDNAGAAVVGGLIGGLIGNQFGDGRGRKAATVAGAVLGASLAHEAAKQKHHRYDDYDRYSQRDYRPQHFQSRPVNRCTTTNETRYVQEINGYDVTYRFHGKTFSKWMDHDPGERVRVRVTVNPLG